MKRISILAALTILASALLFTASISSDEATPAAAPTVQQDKNLTASSAASAAWLQLIDDSKYDDSWDSSSQLFKHTINKKEWSTFLGNIRKPMGILQSRTVLDQRTAKDPQGLPKGDYMVMVYKTSFSNNKDSNELVTLILESDGQWRVLTYQVK